MKAITLWTPWSSLIAAGAKTIETRGWPTRHRGALLIHAAGRWTPDLRDATRWAAGALHGLGLPPLSEPLPRGCVVAVADLADCREMLKAPDPANAVFGHFGPGRYGWVLANVRPLPIPIRWRGKQGLWNVPEELEERVGASLRGRRATA